MISNLFTLSGSEGWKGREVWVWEKAPKQFFNHSRIRDKQTFNVSVWWEQLFSFHRHTFKSLNFLRKIEYLRGIHELFFGCGEESLAQYAYEWESEEKFAIRKERSFYVNFVRRMREMGNRHVRYYVNQLRNAHQGTNETKVVKIWIFVLFGLHWIHFIILTVSCRRRRRLLRMFLNLSSHTTKRDTFNFFFTSSTMKIFTLDDTH